MADFIATGPTNAELIAAKKSITGGFARMFANNAAILQIVSILGFYDLPLNYLDTFRDKVNAVTQAQIKAAFKKHVQLDQMVTVKVAP